jgi:hypothetical protein
MFTTQQLQHGSGNPKKVDSVRTLANTQRYKLVLKKLLAIYDFIYFTLMFDTNVQFGYG